MIYDSGQVSLEHLLLSREPSQRRVSLYRVIIEDLSGRGAARAEDAQGTPTQSQVSPSILVYEDNLRREGDEQEKVEDVPLFSTIHITI